MLSSLLSFRSDWLLKFMYRTASVQFTVAGLSAVKWTHRVMHNIDLTHVVSMFHMYMQRCMHTHAQHVNWALRPCKPLDHVSAAQL